MTDEFSYWQNLRMRSENTELKSSEYLNSSNLMVFARPIQDNASFEPFNKMLRLSSAMLSDNQNMKYYEVC